MFFSTANRLLRKKHRLTSPIKNLHHNQKFILQGHGILRHVTFQATIEELNIKGGALILQGVLTILTLEIYTYIRSMTARDL